MPRGPLPTSGSGIHRGVEWKSKLNQNVTVNRCVKASASPTHLQRSTQDHNFTATITSLAEICLIPSLITAASFQTRAGDVNRSKFQRPQRGWEIDSASKPDGAPLIRMCNTVDLAEKQPRERQSFLHITIFIPNPSSVHDSLGLPKCRRCPRRRISYNARLTAVILHPRPQPCAAVILVARFASLGHSSHIKSRRRSWRWTERSPPS